MSSSSTQSTQTVPFLSHFLFFCFPGFYSGLMDPRLHSGAAAAAAAAAAASGRPPGGGLPPPPPAAAAHHHMVAAAAAAASQWPRHPGM